MRGISTLGAAALAVVVALANPGPAFASFANAIELPADTPEPVGYNLPIDFKFSLNIPYWSVVALQPQSDIDEDLDLKTPGETALDSSNWDVGATDFVAIDSNSGHRPYGSYLTTVSLYGVYLGDSWVQLRKGGNVKQLPVPAWDGVSGRSDPDITLVTLLNNELVRISDIYLNAGDKFWANSTTAGSHLYLMESSSDPASWIQSRIEAGIHNTPTVVDNCTLYTAKVSGWHALLTFGDRLPTNWTTAETFTYALHKYNPAKPTTCPVRNFPNPTPA
jgi:hypothetical protein